MLICYSCKQIIPVTNYICDTRLWFRIHFMIADSLSLSVFQYAHVELHFRSICFLEDSSDNNVYVQQICDIQPDIPVALMSYAQTFF